MSSVAAGEGKVVCVTGASGYIASWLVKLLLERGYTVKASVRDLNDPKKTQHLATLAGAKERLHLFSANLLEEGSFDAIVEGCEGVFHTASPVQLSVSNPEMHNPLPEGHGKKTVICFVLHYLGYLYMRSLVNDLAIATSEIQLEESNKSLLWPANLLQHLSYFLSLCFSSHDFTVLSLLMFETSRESAELLEPAVRGTVNVLRSCAKVSSIKKVVITSSMAAVTSNRELKKDVVVDESWFSDPLYCEEKKVCYHPFLSVKLCICGMLDFCSFNLLLYKI
ncbi:unnamed protein product [Coffea canephora]|uniref:DH200=94 genomic scaffold, scaffold_300 n=1 Tax=Coffea canephora TaxID=49390 RepID=A0A068VE82_COFCA|nr:unnamed protein product [Coffea canephora]